MTPLKRAWIHSKSNLWLLPSLIVAAACALAAALVAIDARIDDPVGVLPRGVHIGSDTALAVLSTIAGSMVTVAVTIFSLTIVALTLASTQFTPRVMGNFIRSRVTQVALGVFVGVFAYCVIVMQCVRSSDDRFVPVLSVLAAAALAFVGIGFLIYFIHHIFSSIQASFIAYRAVSDTLQIIDASMPEALRADDDHAGPSAPISAPDSIAWHAVASVRTGYVQEVDEEALFRLACRRRVAIRVRCGSGSFVVQDEPIAMVGVSPGGALAGIGPDAAVVRGIVRSFAIGPFRTIDQDIVYGVYQLVDMALKALSPAVNDTSTGVMCVNYLSAILARAVQRRDRVPYRFEGGELRLVMPALTFESLLDQSLDQIRVNASDNVAVIIRLLHALELLAGLNRSPARHQAILRHVRLVIEMADRTLSAAHERAQAEAFVGRMHAVWAGAPPDRRVAPVPPQSRPASDPAPDPDASSAQ